MTDCLKGTEECKYTQRMVFEILDDKGVVCDRTIHELNIPLTFNQCIAMKYIRMRNAVKDGIDEFVGSVRPGQSGDPDGPATVSADDPLADIARNG